MKEIILKPREFDILNNIKCNNIHDIGGYTKIKINKGSNSHRNPYLVLEGGDTSHGVSFNRIKLFCITNDSGNTTTYVQFYKHYRHIPSLVYSITESTLSHILRELTLRNII